MASHLSHMRDQTEPVKFPHLPITRWKQLTKIFLLLRGPFPSDSAIEEDARIHLAIAVQFLSSLPTTVKLHCYPNICTKLKEAHRKLNGEHRGCRPALLQIQRATLRLFIVYTKALIFWGQTRFNKPKDRQNYHMDF